MADYRYLSMDSMPHVFQHGCSVRNVAVQTPRVFASFEFYLTMVLMFVALVNSSTRSSLAKCSLFSLISYATDISELSFYSCLPILMFTMSRYEWKVNQLGLC